jgi:hypothetical protein
MSDSNRYLVEHYSTISSPKGKVRLRQTTKFYTRGTQVGIVDLQASSKGQVLFEQMEAIFCRLGAEVEGVGGSDVLEYDL